MRLLVALYTARLLVVIAVKKFLGHLWCLSEELVALAFFDDKVPNDAKRKMVLSLQKPAAEHPLKSANVDPPAVRAKQLEDFVKSSTHRFFNITGFSASFIVSCICLH